MFGSFVVYDAMPSKTKEEDNESVLQDQKKFASLPNVQEYVVVRQIHSVL